jgi:AraC-like DNA-binding protein
MMGPLGLLIRHQRTVRAGLQILERYLDHQDTAIALHASERRDAVVVELGVRSRRFARSRPALDMLVSLYVHLLRGLTQEDWLPELVALPYPAPDDKSPYVHLAQHVEFGHDISAIVIALRDAERRLPGADAEMAEELERLVSREGAPGPRSTVEQVSELISRLLPDGYCTVEVVAERLGVDRRTVHRWLQAEGQSFSGLVESIRRERAVEALREGRESLGEIATHLGFSSLSTFSRWFRAAFGVRASEYRHRD